MTERAGFHTGSLGWVKREIDRSLARILDALVVCTAAPADGADASLPLRTAQTQAHQAQAALQIVGLGGATCVIAELEALLAQWEQALGQAPRAGIPVDAAERALREVLNYLDALMNGAPNQPLRLWPAYSAVHQARGCGPADPVDLFYVDLSTRPPARAPRISELNDEERQQNARAQRARYLRGLLAYLKNDPAGVADMRAAVEAIELVQCGDGQRVFWWAALAAFDALLHGALPGDLDAKRLCTRVEQQMRHLVEGSPDVPERLLREVLYCVARAAPATEHIREVQQSCRLGGALPSEPDLPENQNIPRARSALVQARNAWDLFCTGPLESCSGFCEAAKAFHSEAMALGHPQLAQLAAHLNKVADWISKPASDMNEALALETTTALLLAESAVASFSSLSEDFAAQSAVMCSRLEACMEGTLLRKALTIPLLDEMSRRAQERLVTAQTAAEMQARLREAESTLDAFFRQPDDRTALAALPASFEQIDHSLQSLGEEAARPGLARCKEAILRFANAPYSPNPTEFEQVAEALARLGFQLDALARGMPGSTDSSCFLRSEAEMQMIAAIESPGEFHEQASALAPPVSWDATSPIDDHETVDLGDQRISKTQFALFCGEAHMHLMALNEELETSLQHGVITDAMLKAVHAFASLSDSLQMKALHPLARALERALAKLALGQLSGEEERLLAEAVEALEQSVDQTVALVQPALHEELLARLQQLAAPAIVPTPAPVAAAADSSSYTAEGDAALLGMFLQEANELVPAIAAALQRWRTQPDDLTSSQSVRRWLHTLKGSARTAGAITAARLIHDMESCIETAPGLLLPSGAFEELASFLQRLGIMLGLPPQMTALSENQAASDTQEVVPPEPQSDLPGHQGMRGVNGLALDSGAELSIARGRVEGEVRALKAAAHELAADVSRLRFRLLEGESQADPSMPSRFDDLQLSTQQFNPLDTEHALHVQDLMRMLIEFQTVSQALLQAIEKTEAALAEQARFEQQWQQQLAGMKKVPLATLSERLQAVVRRTAEELGKKATFSVQGEELEIERAVLERLRPPLEHLLRNAVTHGIEAVENRVAAGKTATGAIGLEAARDNDEVVVTVCDDGAGLDVQRIHERALGLGFTHADDCSDAEAAELIFRPGFSTASGVSEFAGRGIGLDVVQSEIASLGGRIDVSFKQGGGTRFACRIPLTLPQAAIPHDMPADAGSHQEDERV